MEIGVVLLMLSVVTYCLYILYRLQINLDMNLSKAALQ